MIKLVNYREFPNKLRISGKLVKSDLINSEQFIKNITKMKEILAKDGVGLAATQVNWPIQLFLLCIDEDDNRIEPEVFINPTIKNYSKNKVKMEEGCLSFQGLYMNIKRPEEVTWSYETLDGKIFEKVSTGFYSRAVQHEIDHCQGKVFIDKASAVQKLKIKKWFKA